MTTLILVFLMVIAGLALVWRGAGARPRGAGALLVLGGVLATPWVHPEHAALLRQRAAESTLCDEFQRDLSSWQYQRTSIYRGPLTREQHRRQWAVLSPLVRLAAVRCLTDVAPCEQWTTHMHDADGLTEPAIAELVRAFETRTTCRLPAHERGGAS